MAETEKQIKQLEKQERVQKAKLAKQIDTIYRSGVNPSTLERMLSEDAKKAETHESVLSALKSSSHQYDQQSESNTREFSENSARRFQDNKKIIAINFLRKRNSSKNYKKRSKNANLR